MSVAQTRQDRRRITICDCALFRTSGVVDTGLVNNTSGHLIGEELFPSPSVYHCLCSLNRCYFFFVLRCLSLQTSGFPLECQVVLPQHSDCQDVEVLPKIRVWFLLLFVLSFGFCTLHMETWSGFCVSTHSRTTHRLRNDWYQSESTYSVTRTCPLSG